MNVFHQELSGVGRRFEHQLTADAHHLADATSVGSKIICCYTLGNQTALCTCFFNSFQVCYGKNFDIGLFISHPTVPVSQGNFRVAPIISEDNY